MAPYELFLSELFIKTPLDPGSIGFNTILLKTRSILIRNGTERNGGLYINEVFLYTHKILFSRVMLNLPAGGPPNAAKSGCIICYTYISSTYASIYIIEMYLLCLTERYCICSYVDI